MRLKRVLGFALCMVMVVTIFSSVSSAQIKRPLRWLGQGYSDGYHQCNPGPNSDYYNPYSAHNTLLISQSGNASNPLPSQYMQRGPIQQGIPYSVYASPMPANQGKLYESLPFQPVDSEAYEPEQDATESISEENKSEGTDAQEDNSAFVPPTPQSDFSQTGFQVQPKVNENNLFDPFGEN